MPPDMSRRSTPAELDCELAGPCDSKFVTASEGSANQTPPVSGSGGTSKPGPSDASDTEEDPKGAPVKTEAASATVSPAAGGMKLPDWYDDSFTKAAQAAVPAIGDALHRWYDIPYRFLRWWDRAWRKRLVPPRVQIRIHEWILTLWAYNDHDRNKAHSTDDPWHNLHVPEDEHVTVPALWVIELFPPSAAAELIELTRKYKPSVQLFGDEDDAVSFLSDARAGHGYDWFRLEYSPKPGLIVSDGWPRPRAEYFARVELTAVQLGTGLTAVIAQFHLNEDATHSLDREWHQPHEPQLRRLGTYLVADDREQSAYNQTQEARRRPHDAARKWMSQTCPGLFAQAGQPQPLMDLLLLDKASPTNCYRPAAPGTDVLRALGLTGLHTVIVSTVVREFAVTQTSLDMCPSMGTSRTWALWGNRSAAAAARPNLPLHSSDENSALAHAADHETRDVFLALAVTEMIRYMQQQYTELRDTARKQHDNFSADYLQSLRQTLLTLSIDLLSTKVDVPAWWKRHRSSIPPFYLGDPNDVERPIEFTEHLRSRQTDALATLGAADEAIRDVLGTVASLGAARDASRTGHTALYVAGASLVVATVTLLFTTVGHDSVAAQVWKWLKMLEELIWHNIT